MKTEYIVALIAVVGGIMVALINVLLPILIKRLDSATPGQKELPPAIRRKRSKWIWVSVMAVTMIGLSLWLFYIVRFESSLDPSHESTFKVSAESGWQSSRTVTEGARIVVLAVGGQWSPRLDSIGNPMWTNADGLDTTIFSSGIGLMAPLGSLIAKIGDGAPFKVVMNEDFIANTTGQLFFRINDVNLDDNSGSITIQIRVGLR